MLTCRQTIEAMMRRGARLSMGRSFPAHRQPAEVRIDNETSDRFTILDVFADDRQGLLYVITNAIFQLGLSVHASRISTRLDQVADVFYVTSMEGRRWRRLVGWNRSGRRSSARSRRFSVPMRRKTQGVGSHFHRRLKGGGDERS